MAKKIIKAQMKQRRDTLENWATVNPVLLDGELGIVSDDPNLYKVGDGSTAWNALPFRGFDGTIVHTTGESLNAVMSQAAVTEALKVAGNFNPSGTYPDLMVGDLVGRGESVPAEFSFRASGGKSIKDGTAWIKELRGNSVVWNQRLQWRGNGNVYYGLTVTYEDGTIHIQGAPEDTEFSYYSLFWDEAGNVRKFTKNHYYLIRGASEHFELIVYNNVSVVGSNCITQKTGDVMRLALRGHDLTIGQEVNESFSAQVIDLTQMFGAGNEPTTIEEFNARKPIVEDEYAYNEGEVIHMTAEGIKSVGDNAVSFDGEFVLDENESGPTKKKLYEEGKIYVGCSVGDYVRPSAIKDYSKYGNGFKISSTNGYGIGTLIRVLPNTDYYISCNIQGAGAMRIGWLTRDGYYISNTYDNNKTYRSPSNAYYGLVSLIPLEADNVLFTDIMLTLVHSGWKVDTDAGYQPYWEDRLIFDQRIKDAFPNGMGKWDLVYNKDGKGYIVKGTGVVDLGSLNWAKEWYNEADNWRIYAEFRQKATGFSNMINRIYPNANTGDGTMADKTITGHNNPDLLYIYIRDASYSAEGADALIAYLQGVPLFYQLAEPTLIEYDEQFNLDYRVADFGTEEIIADTPSAPIDANIIYQFNAVDQIRENYNEIQALKAIIATMQAQLASLTSNE